MRRQQRHRALTALEVGSVIAVVAVFVLIVGIVSHRFITQRRIKQTRRDLGALAAAIEAYYVDWSVYPFPIEYMVTPEFFAGPWASKTEPTREHLIKRYQLGAPDDYGHYSINAPCLWPQALTTPITYLSPQIPADPLSSVGDRSYGYMIHRQQHGQYPFILVGCGPDGDRDLPLYAFGRRPEAEKWVSGKTYSWSGRFGFPMPLVSYKYDPTNGLRSDGDILYFNAIDTLDKSPWSNVR